MGATPARSRRPVRCPRCGYDQHGETSTWTACCPVESTCVECGLRIRWAEVFNPTIRPPAWCMEYGPWWSVPLRTVRTVSRAWQPWRFWRTLTMMHEPRWRRVATCFVLLLLALYVLFAVAHGALAAQYWKSWPAWMLPADAPATAWDAAWQAALKPLSGPFFHLRVSIYPRDVFFREWYPMLGTVLWAAVFLVMCPVGFAALPVSRKRAKVRWTHIARITAYGLLPPLSLLFWWTALKGFHTLPMNPYVAAISRLLLSVATVAVAIHPLLWWSFATGRYLKIPHPWAVGLALVIIAALLTILAMSLVTILRVGV